MDAQILNNISINEISELAKGGGQGAVFLDFGKEE